jgi:ABC-2 type transport system ATP-binding protein
MEDTNNFLVKITLYFFYIYVIGFMASIKVEGLRKSFGETQAVNNVSFEVQKGKIFGLLGPNGAGKTTTIRMLNNIYIPDGGSIKVLDETPSTAIQNRVGYLPEERGLYKKLKVIEQITYFGELKGMKTQDAKEKGLKWLDRLGAKDWAYKKVQELSKGMQQKVQFIATINHDPEVLILDEPFSGFDPINTEELKNIVLEQKEMGKTIILSTHVMHQVEALCEDICLINKGKSVLYGNVMDIKHSYGYNSFILQYDGNIDSIISDNRIKISDKIDNRIEASIVDKSITTNEIISKAIENATVYQFEMKLPSMHEIFLDKTKPTV